MNRWLYTLAFVCLCGLGIWLAGVEIPAPPLPPPPPVITVVGVGDIFLGRKLAVEMQEKGDYSLPFASVAPLLNEADIAFGNFEGTLCEKGPWPTTGMVFRLHPDSVKSLLATGVDAVSVANNHFADGGDDCIRFSLDYLRDHGIATAGAGETYDEAHQPAILERKGVRFAFLGYTYAERNDRPSSESVNASGAPAKAPAKAAPSRPTIAGRRSENVIRDVAAAREKADIVIVSLHDGAEYLTRVAQETQDFARAAIDAGALAVFGHHPHVPQRVERYKDGWIFYSLGNFVFQQNTPPNVRHALIARLTFSGKALTQVEAVPVYIENYARPRPATPEEAAEIFKRIDLEQPVLWKGLSQE